MANPLRSSIPVGINNQAPSSMPAPTNPINQSGPGSILQRLIFNKMYQNNPQFRQFADSMQGKTPEQAFQEQGLDYSQYQNITPAQIKTMLGF